LRTVVTGGAGFIGSHLVKRLIGEGREVVVASDFSRLGTENLSSLGIEVQCQEVDLRDYNQALRVMEGAEAVFHLAARVGSIEYLHGTKMSELEALQANLMIDANTFRACLKNNVKKLIYASSVAVYPMDRQYSFGAIFSEEDLDLSQNQPWTSDTGHRTINPDGGYGWAKLIGELQLSWMENIDIGIARIFNIYGENEPLGESAHVVADLIRKAILYPEEEFVVWGNGEQTRDFLYVTDCVEALLKLEEKASSPPIVVNIGSGEATPIKTVAEKVAQFSGKNLKVRYDPAKPVGPLSRTADITKAKALLKWRPKITLDEGLERTYLWVERVASKH
jgi:nucleoside-diphosphate-sugar epimerase